MQKSPQKNITFVTAYLNIYETPFQNKDSEWRFRQFRKIAETGIPISIICSPDSSKEIQQLADIYENIKVIQYMNLSDTWIYSACKEVEDRIGEQLRLPNNRNLEKDTREYILLMNAKTEFMKMAIEKNVWRTTHFAWIDFNIFHIFKGEQEECKAAKILQDLSYRTFAPDCLTISGCWEWGKEHIKDIYLIDGICWRFCGGFFLGSAKRVLEFHDYVTTYLPRYLEKERILVWEVNFWAYLELHYDFSVLCYPGDHNLSILDFNASSCCVKLSALPSCRHIRYDYPDCGNYIPTSTAHIFFKGKHIINTRFVNYWLHPNGQYLIKDRQKYLRTRNFYSELDPGSLVPLNFKEIIDNNANLSCQGGSIYGLEDIRLYDYFGELRFIATSINYSGVGHNRMIYGKYDIEMGEVADCSVIVPPGSNRWTEKNWIPIIKGATSSIASLPLTGSPGEEYFIYKWMPFEAGKLEDVFNEESQTMEKQLNITIQWEHQTPMFSKVRGSTPFIATDDGLVGVVHFSYEDSPRQYYHMLVLLDRTTLLPLKYSEYLYFNQISIEFCIGFAILENKYHFWVSNFDRDPELIIIDVPEIPMMFSFS